MFDEIIDRSQTGSLKWERYDQKKVVPMWVADMDFRSPAPVIDALRQRAEHGVFGYTEPRAELIDTVFDYLEQQHGFSIDATWLVWLPGLVPALNLICRAFAGSAITATPIYPPFLFAPQYCDKHLIRVPLEQTSGGWMWNWQQLEDSIEDDTRLLLLCNPHNPVGRVFTREEMERLAEFARRHDLIVSSDEIHCDLILEPECRHQPFATLSDDSRDRSISLYAPSKTYNLPGLSCAFAVIPNPELRMAFRKTARGIITEVNAMGYTACEAAYRHGEPWRQQLLEQLRHNRDRLTATLREHVPQVRCSKIEATYLAWLDVRALDLKDPARHFEDHGIGLSDGNQFGMPGFLRLNFGCPPALLETGLERFVNAVAKT